MPPQTHLVSVFTSTGENTNDGGNLAPIVLEASSMSDASMQDIARSYGHESSFVLAAPPDSDFDWQLRFWVPEHEMEMCGHATVGTTWLLRKLDLISDSRTEVKFSTKSGIVDARILDINDTGDPLIEISQPRGWVKPVADTALQQEILSVLRISSDQLHADYPVQNACTSRVKTMIPLKDSAILNHLQPDFSRMKQICENLGSTGLYPYAIVSNDNAEEKDKVLQVEARQFPMASGYPEDPATGIAAAALGYALLENKVFGTGRTTKEVCVVQGVAMGCPSEIRVRINGDGSNGCWIGGRARWGEKP